MSNQFSVYTKNRMFWACLWLVHSSSWRSSSKFLIWALFDFQSHNNGGCAWWGITAVPWAYPLFLSSGNSAYCYGGRQEGISLQLNHKYSFPQYSLLKPHTSDCSVIVKLSKMALNLFVCFFFSSNRTSLGYLRLLTEPSPCATPCRTCQRSGMVLQTAKYRTAVTPSRISRGRLVFSVLHNILDSSFLSL